jgi:[acyl-carrier-protein] S-malonyltransferase
MQPAQEEVARVLGSLQLADPRFPVASNVSGGLVHTAEEVREALIQQVTGTVRWVDCVKTLIAEGVETYVELAPGMVLSGLLKQIDPAQKSVNVEDIASLEKALIELQATETAE